MRIIAIVLCGLLLLAGCTYESGITADSLVPRITQAQATADQAKSAAEVAKASADGKATPAYVDQKIAAIPQNTSSYTKAEIDARFSTYDSQIATLKSEIATLKSGTTPGTGSATGSVTYVTNPVSIPQLFTSTAGMMQQMYTIRIQNGTNQWQYVKPVITFSIASGQSPTTVTGLTLSVSSGSYNITTAASNFSIAPALNTGNTTSFIATPITGANGNGEVQIGAGQSIDLLVVIQNMTTSTNCLWNVSNSISARGL